MGSDGCGVDCQVRELEGGARDAIRVIVCVGEAAGADMVTINLLPEHRERSGEMCRWAALIVLSAWRNWKCSQASAGLFH